MLVLTFFCRANESTLYINRYTKVKIIFFQIHCCCEVRFEGWRHNGLQAGERPTFYKIASPKIKLNLLKLFVFEVVFGLALACC
jgi:hypothetical protein